MSLLDHHYLSNNLYLHCSILTFCVTKGLVVMGKLVSLSLTYLTLFFCSRREQGAGPLPGSWTYHNNQGEQNRKDQLTVSGGNKVTVVMSKSSDRLSPMIKETRSKFKKSQSIDEIDIGSYKVYRLADCDGPFTFRLNSIKSFMKTDLFFFLSSCQYSRGQLQFHRAADQFGPLRAAQFTGADQHGSVAVRSHVRRRAGLPGTWSHQPESVWTEPKTGHPAEGLPL